jgi:hypothetical protein
MNFSASRRRTYLNPGDAWEQGYWNTSGRLLFHLNA